MAVNPHSITLYLGGRRMTGGSYLAASQLMFIRYSARRG
jgi:hypothetical protein